jgi:predicted  nucleic acid-binding Zn-ribbon protein
MEPLVFLAAIILVVGIPAVTMVKLARLRASRQESPSANVLERLEGLERNVQDLQHELGETQERLDFAERLLSKTRNEPQLGS